MAASVVVPSPENKVTAKKAVQFNHRILTKPAQRQSVNKDQQKSGAVTTSDMMQDYLKRNTSQALL